MSEEGQVGTKQAVHQPAYFSFDTVRDFSEYLIATRFLRPRSYLDAKIKFKR